MADRSPAPEDGKKGRLLKAKPLEETPRQAAAVDTSPAPIPVTPAPAAPIPVSGGVGRPARSAGVARPAPVEARPVPPAPIPVTPAPAAPIPVGGGVGRPAPSAGRPAPSGKAPAGKPSGEGPADEGSKARPILVTEEQRKKAQPRVTEHRGSKATGVREELEEIEEQGHWALFWRDFLNNQPSWLTSLVFHMAMLVVLGVWTLSTPKRETTFLSALPEPEELELGEMPEMKLEQLQRGPEALDIIDRDTPESLEPLVDMEHAAEGLNAASLRPQPFFTEVAPWNDHWFEEGRGTGVLKRFGTGKGDKGKGHGLAGTGRGMGGRGGRRGNAVGRGATPESEKAVNLALEWLANHQLPDGGWSFDHTVAPSCQGKCGNPGDQAEARIGATALGILPFLGAGQTHQVGKYKKTVRAGLMYLMARMQVGRDGGSLYDAGRGRMYSHGLATIALCEAYAMCVNPKDVIRPKRVYDGNAAPPSPSDIKSLREKQQDSKQIAADNAFNAALGRAAQAALKFVSTAQHPDGGWRYEPRQAGDTSVVGWQVMALKSGQMAHLMVNPMSLVGASKFLDSVQIGDYGDDYGYTDPTRGTIATRAIGLLCRMYMGWPHDHPGLAKGVQGLDAEGPSQGNMYYNYYATQVMHHYGGDPWKRWNPKMRDSLTGRQAKNGHEAGSWYFAGDHGSEPGGRLYITALAAMTLEVYYRHMPLYRRDIFGQGKDKPGNQAAKPDAEQEEEKPEEKPEE